MANAIEVTVPDIGDFKNIPVIEVFVKAGDTVKVEDSLMTLESDKATMDVPSPASGVVKSIMIKTGDKVSKGTPVLTLEPSSQPAPQTPATTPVTAAAPAAKAAANAPAPASVPVAAEPASAPRSVPEVSTTALSSGPSHASPSVRQFARELGVDLSRLKGTGPKNRILHE
ncbi:MAG TPA: biotin/lipoyl-containing protein, partial [Burkholderiales bacterium]|nr:biotin/lipoyl-containing protein [Burkholderiales bacterium]